MSNTLLTLIITLVSSVSVFASSPEIIAQCGNIQLTSVPSADVNHPAHYVNGINVEGRKFSVRDKENYYGAVQLSLHSEGGDFIVENYNGDSTLTIGDSWGSGFLAIIEKDGEQNRVPCDGYEEGGIFGGLGMGTLTISIEEFRNASKPLCCGGADVSYLDRLSLGKTLDPVEVSAYVQSQKEGSYKRLMDKLEEISPAMLTFLEKNPGAKIDDALGEIAKLLNVQAMSPVAIASLDEMIIVIVNLENQSK